MEEIENLIEVAAVETVSEVVKVVRIKVLRVTFT